MWTRCDSVVPEQDAVLVVEGFFDAGKPLPPVQLRQTRPLNTPYPAGAATAVNDGSVTVTIGSEDIVYRPDASQPGRYLPETLTTLPARARLAIAASWNDQRAEAETIIPPPIHIDSLRIAVSDTPVAGIILDSLFIDPAVLDSLPTLDTLRTATRELVYLIEVTVLWSVDFEETDADSLYWIRTQLKPILPITLDDFFFKPEQIFRERTADKHSSRGRAWTGVYAVPVEEATDPVPPHDLRVSLVRSGQDYASYASSLDDPVRREPAWNVRGAIGIIAGLSVDSMRVQVE